MSQTEKPSVALPPFILATVGYEGLPAIVQEVMADVVGKSYDELVLRAPNALEKSAGLSLVFLLCLEIIEQFDLARSTDFTGTGTGSPVGASAGEGAGDERGNAIARHLRLVAAKQQTANFLARAQALRDKLAADNSYGRFRR